MDTQSLTYGVDVGSTTIKLVVVDPTTKKILWSKYQRHETKQPEVVKQLLLEATTFFPDVTDENISIFITGSGASPIAPHIGARFVQEVNAVTLAVEQLHPEVGSVIELGGQDAKIIIFKERKDSDQKQVIASMNDKCASGTGATIDKCVVKVGMSNDELGALKFDPSHLHHVAAKCGVFAETDIVNLVKSGIPRNEIMCSLADAIVSQNLSVLTRGNTLREKVLLLGGPNTYLGFLQECWRYRIPQTWQERGYNYSQDTPIEELIFAPENAEYYAAYGAILFGLTDVSLPARYLGIDKLTYFIEHGRKQQLGENAGPSLMGSTQDKSYFLEQYKVPGFIDATPSDGVLNGYIGLDGGSTSSKLVFISPAGDILKKVYQLSEGNPIVDMIAMFTILKNWGSSRGGSLNVLGFGVTGYAGDVMEKALAADTNIVETIAHMLSANHYFDDVDVICDVGGQDIKVLFMQNGQVKNFRLSNSCSAGNGSLLQAMANQFGIPIEEYAETAFGAELSPTFSYGCAVFLDSDRVNFQKEGFNGEELLAGLALVLPKNIWQYIVQIPRMAELGRIYVLQGGTQYNLAAVKAQVDYIKERVPDAEVYVHPHTGEAGAIGAAFEARRVVERRGHSTFIGLDASINIQYSSRNDETTQCHFCVNDCSRTFIDTETPNGDTARYISGFSCEKGTVEDYDALRTLNKSRKKRMKRYPNLVAYEAKLCYKHFFKHDALPTTDAWVDDIEVKRTLFGGVKQKSIRRHFQRSSEAAQERRKSIRIGMPKVLNMWSTGPFWRSYFEALGIKAMNVVFSDDTSEELWQAGGKYGSIDPCYPSKVGQAHIHNLFFTHHIKKPLDYIFFPAITHIPTYVENVMDTACCPIVAGTPAVLAAAFTKEKDFFAERNIEYINPTLSLCEPILLKQNLFDAFTERLAITEDESNFAVDQAFAALEQFDRIMQEKGKQILEEVEEQDRVAILMIGRPYHNDPGMNHNILEEYQALGYPILSMRSIPKDKQFLNRYFGEQHYEGESLSALDIRDIWPENYSVNSVQKVWAAKFASRHPNVAVIDLSSFKCGHDAPTYGLIDRVTGEADSCFSAMHDIDANKPSGSIKIRVKTYAHTLQLSREKLQDKSTKNLQLEISLALKKLELFNTLVEKDKPTSLLQEKISDVTAEIETLQNMLSCKQDPKVVPLFHEAKNSDRDSDNLIKVAIID